MSRRKKHVEEHANHESWAIPYGDLVTLLLAFFVTMYSISNVNSGKYRVLSDSLNAAFRGTPKSPQAVAVGQAPGSINESLPISQVNQIFSAGLPAYMHMPLPQANGTVRTGQSTPGSADPRDAANTEHAQYELALAQRLQKMEDDVSGAMSSLVGNKDMTITKRGENLEVQISTDILFSSGAAKLSTRAEEALRALAAALKPWPNHVRVEGHTDNRPIRTSQFPTNWELSAARAASVVRLFATSGVAPERMTVVGYGEFAPLQTNGSAAGRDANRRVMVVILGSKESANATG
jgi:chemotaxis protein MotB